MKIKFFRGYLPTNYHGTQKKGEPWNQQTVRARWLVKFVYVRLSCEKPSEGHRIIVYYRSGASHNFDIYIDRRDEL